MQALHLLKRFSLRFNFTSSNARFYEDEISHGLAILQSGDILWISFRRFKSYPSDKLFSFYERKLSNRLLSVGYLYLLLNLSQLKAANVD